MRRTLAAVSTAVLAATVISGTSLAAAASARPASSGTEHFQGMTTSQTSTFSLIASGVFTAVGDTTLRDPTIFRFPSGTIKLIPHLVQVKQTLNVHTCLLQESQRVTYKITGGTGAYAGIVGSGKSVLRELAVLARNSRGKCAPSLPAAAFQAIVTFTGPVIL